MQKLVAFTAVLGVLLASCSGGSSSGGGGGGSGGSGGSGGGGTAGGSGGAGAGNGTDPLYGIWVDQITPTSADDKSVTIIFSQSGFTLLHTQDNPTSAASKPGCNETYSDQGTYAQGLGTLAITVNGDESVSDTACANSSDEGTSYRAATTVSGTWTYSISGGTLTLGIPGGSPMTFTQM